MTDSMIERVARAIAEAWRKDTIPFMEVEPDWPDWQNEARAAIEAMREPTEAMLQVPIPKSGSFDDCYRAMIDAALKDKP